MFRQGQRPLGELDGLSPVAEPAVRMGRPEPRHVVPRLREFGIQSDGFPIMFHRLVGLAALLQSNGHCRCASAGVGYANRMALRGNAVPPLPSCPDDSTPRLSLTRVAAVARIQPQRLPILSNGLVQWIGLAQQVCQHTVRRPRIGLNGNGFAKLLLRLRRFAQASEYDAK